ncbi:MAG: YeeE/YedE thiosulfate transporter family protein [Gemmatimonadaceae bacterium]
MTGIAASTPPTAAAPPGAVGRLRIPPWARLAVMFGILGVAAIALFGPIGVSTTYPRFIGEIARVLNPAWAKDVPYFAKVGALLKPETMLVVGLLIGGFVASRGRAKAPAIEQIHPAERSATRRYLDAFAGGVLIIFGARLAGGCTSGHIISGITQMALSGILFGAAVFAAGIATAKLLGRGR